MKKLLLGMLAIVAMVATSCQKDVNINGGDATDVVITVSVPDTRVFSDGYSATTLKYAVYDVNNDYLSAHTTTVNDAFDADRKATVKLRLTTGNKYSMVFWAEAPNNPHYVVDFENKTMTVNYTGAISNDETRDAFYCNTGVFTVAKGMAAISAVLTRPFAQLNIGSCDFAESEAAGHKVTYSKVVVPAYKVLNLLTGKTEGTKEDVTFAYAPIPDHNAETFPVEVASGEIVYEYLAMNYILMDVATNTDTVEITYYYTTGDSNPNLDVEKYYAVGSVPLQRNYRTNIYGYLFTEFVEGEVEIDPGYDNPVNDTDHNVVAPLHIVPGTNN